MTDDIADTWEDLANGEELDKKLDKLVLPTVKDVKDSSKNSAPVPPRLVEDTTASRPNPPQPTVRILKRESTNNTQNNCASADRQQRPIRTLEEREAAYAEARLRILGAACSPEDELEARALVEASAAKELLKSAESPGIESTGPTESIGKESAASAESVSKESNGSTESAGKKLAGCNEFAGKESAGSAGKESAGSAGKESAGSAVKESAGSAGKELAGSNGSADKKLAESIKAAGTESAGSLRNIAKESTGSTELILESSTSSTDQSLEPTKDSSANR